MVLVFQKENELALELSKRFDDCRIITELERLVFTRHRGTAIYTIGKTGSIKSLPVLYRAFDEYRDTDPFILPRLVFEIRWLEQNRSFDLIDKMLESPCYVTPWIALDCLHGLDMDQTTLVYYERMANDTNKLISDEAKYLYDLQIQHLNHASYEKPTHRRRLKEIHKRKPTVCIFDVDVRFGGYLRESNRKDDYSIDELYKFIEDYRIIDRRT